MLKEESDQVLIDIVKSNKKNASRAMTEIINRHSGIFIEMVNHFVPVNSPYCDRKDLIEEKEYHIYKALMKYDESRGAKFSTHLGNEAKWLCLNTYNKAKSKSTFSSSDQQFDIEPQFNPIVKSIEEEIYKKVLNVIDEYPDERVKKIFKMRYIKGEGNKVMPWRKISDELNMSIQGCINIHNTAVKKIQQKVNR